MALPGFLRIAMAFAVLGAPAAMACRRDTDCIVGDRSCRILQPEGRDGAAPLGAILFAMAIAAAQRG